MVLNIVNAFCFFRRRNSLSQSNSLLIVIDGCQGMQCSVRLNANTSTTCKAMSLMDVPRGLGQRSPRDIILQDANIDKAIVGRVTCTCLL